MPLRLSVVVVPYQASTSGAATVPGNVNNDPRGGNICFLEIAKETLTLDELRRSISQRHARLYPTKPDLKIHKLQDSDGNDLDLSYTVGDVFDDIRTNKESSTVRVIRANNDGREDSIPPDSALRRWVPRKRIREDSLQLTTLHEDEDVKDQFTGRRESPKHKKARLRADGDDDIIQDSSDEQRQYAEARDTFARGPSEESEIVGVHIPSHPASNHNRIGRSPLLGRDRHKNDSEISNAAKDTSELRTLKPPSPVVEKPAQMQQPPEPSRTPEVSQDIPSSPPEMPGADNDHAAEEEPEQKLTVLQRVERAISASRRPPARSELKQQSLTAQAKAQHLVRPSKGLIDKLKGIPKNQSKSSSDIFEMPLSSDTERPVAQKGNNSSKTVQPSSDDLPFTSVKRPTNGILPMSPTRTYQMKNKPSQEKLRSENEARIQFIEEEQLRSAGINASSDKAAADKDVSAGKVEETVKEKPAPKPRAPRARPQKHAKDDNGTVEEQPVKKRPGRRSKAQIEAEAKAKEEENLNKEVANVDNDAIEVRSVKKRPGRKSKAQIEAEAKAKAKEEAITNGDDQHTTPRPSPEVSKKNDGVQKSVAFTKTLPATISLPASTLPATDPIWQRAPKSNIVIIPPHVPEYAIGASLKKNKTSKRRKLSSPLPPIQYQEDPPVVTDKSHEKSISATMLDPKQVLVVSDSSGKSDRENQEQTESVAEDDKPNDGEIISISGDLIQKPQRGIRNASPKLTKSKPSKSQTPEPEVIEQNAMMQDVDMTDAAADVEDNIEMEIEDKDIPKPKIQIAAKSTSKQTPTPAAKEIPKSNSKLKAKMQPKPQKEPSPVKESSSDEETSSEEEDMESLDDEQEDDDIKIEEEETKSRTSSSSSSKATSPSSKSASESEEASASEEEEEEEVTTKSAEKTTESEGSSYSSSSSSESGSSEDEDETPKKQAEPLAPPVVEKRRSKSPVKPVSKPTPKPASPQKPAKEAESKKKANVQAKFISPPGPTRILRSVTPDKKEFLSIPNPDELKSKQSRRSKSPVKEVLKKATKGASSKSSSSKDATSESESDSGSSSGSGSDSASGSSASEEKVKEPPKDVRSKTAASLLFNNAGKTAASAKKQTPAPKVQPSEKVTQKDAAKPSRATKKTAEKASSPAKHSTGDDWPRGKRGDQLTKSTAKTPASQKAAATQAKTPASQLRTPSQALKLSSSQLTALNSSTPTSAQRPNYPTLTGMARGKLPEVREFHASQSDKKPKVTASASLATLGGGTNHDSDYDGTTSESEASSNEESSSSSGSESESESESGSVNNRSGDDKANKKTKTKTKTKKTLPKSAIPPHKLAATAVAPAKPKSGMKSMLNYAGWSTK